jgi:beta-xylosidase
MEPRPDRFSGQGNPSYLAVRQQNNDFACSVTLTSQPRTVNCVAGLAAFQNEGHYYAINVRIEGGHLTEISLERPAAGTGRGRGRPQGGAAGATQTRPAVSEKLPKNLRSIDLKIEGAGRVTRCLYKVGNGAFVQLGQDLPSSFISTDTAGGFQGVTLGMFAHN